MIWTKINASSLVLISLICREKKDAKSMRVVNFVSVS